MWKFIHKFGSPKYFYNFAYNASFSCGIMAFILIGFAMFSGLFVVPPDYQQGDGFRIIYIHAPCAFIAMSVYMTMAVCALIQLVWRVKITAMWMQTSATFGAWITFLALFTGSIWGKPMWGTYWIWDARLTSALILFFLYLGVIALQSAIQDKQSSDKAGAILVLVGVVNIPIIHYSVNWWNTLHQGATISALRKPAIDLSMLYPLLAMILGLFFLYLTVTCIRVRHEILKRNSRANWVKQLVAVEC